MDFDETTSFICCNQQHIQNIIGSCIPLPRDSENDFKEKFSNELERVGGDFPNLDIHSVVEECLKDDQDAGPNVLETGPSPGISTTLELWFMYHAYKEGKQVACSWKEYLINRSGGSILFIEVNGVKINITFEHLVTCFEGPGFSNWLRGRDEGFVPEFTTREVPVVPVVAVVSTPVVDGSDE
jgi:hypothetical protein